MSGMLCVCRRERVKQQKNVLYVHVEDLLKDRPSIFNKNSMQDWNSQHFNNILATNRNTVSYFGFSAVI